MWGICEEYEKDGGGTSGNKHSVTTQLREWILKFGIGEGIDIGKDMENTGSYLEG